MLVKPNATVVDCERVLRAERTGIPRARIEGAPNAPGETTFEDEDEDD